MYTLLKALALISCSVLVADYENPKLPDGSSMKIPQVETRNIRTERYRIKSTAKVVTPGLSSQQFLFAKQAFLSEKRDEAIRLLRQELDSGYDHNRDNMLLRLGQLYTEKYMELSYLESQYFSEKMKEWDKQPKKSGKQPILDHGRSNRYLKLSLDTFLQLEKKYPKHPKMDEVVFFIGFVNMEMGQNAKGIQYLNKLVKQFPKSVKKTEAIMYLADHYFEKQQFKIALSNYQELLGRKKEDTFDYASYKAAWCELNLGQNGLALKRMQNLIDRLETEDSKSNFSLRDQALKDLVLFYAETENVDAAMKYFESKIGREQALENLKGIAAILLSKSRDDAALKAYRILIAAFGDDVDGPQMHLAIYDAQVRLGQTNEGVATLQKALERYNKEWVDNFPSEKQENAKNNRAALIAETKNAAFFYHSTGQKTKNKAYYPKALALYQMVVNHVEDPAEKRQMAFFIAEIQYAQGKFSDAADAYLAIARQEPKDKFTEESYYNALLALDNLTAKADKLKRYSKEEMKKAEFKELPLDKSEARFVEVGQAYLKEFPKAKRNSEIQYRIGSIYYQRFHFDEAVASFETLIENDPKHQSSMTAAHLVLDIHNMRGNYAALETAADKFVAKKELGTAQFREEVQQIKSELSFKGIEKLEAENKWEEAGKKYYDFYKAKKTGKLAESAFYNAVISYEKSDAKEEFAKVSKEFVDKFPDHEYVRRLTLNSATIAEKQYDFSTAEKLFTQFYEKYPKDSQAMKSLYNSAVYAEILGRYEEAEQRYEKYLRTAKTTQSEKAEIEKTQLGIAVKRGQWKKVSDAYHAKIRAAGSESQKLKLYAELANVYESNGRAGDKQSIVAKVGGIVGNKSVSDPEVARLVAEHRFGNLVPERSRYEKLTLKFPVERLVPDIKKKQKALIKLSAAYDEVLKLGSGEWSVAALYEKSLAYENFVRGFRSLQLPANYKGDERKTLEIELKTLDKQMIEPLENKRKEILQTCVDKSAEYFLVSDYVGKCYMKNSGSVADTRPSGHVPVPGYWTTRWAQ